MARLFSTVNKLLNRWSGQQETAWTQLTERQTAGERVAAFSKSERVDAKFFLLALLPFVPVAVSDQLGSSRGVLWHTWFWLSAVWAISIFAIGCAAYWRAFRRSPRRKP